MHLLVSTTEKVLISNSPDHFKVYCAGPVHRAEYNGRPSDILPFNFMHGRSFIFTVGHFGRSLQLATTPTNYSADCLQ